MHACISIFYFYYFKIYINIFSLYKIYKNMLLKPFGRVFFFYKLYSWSVVQMTWRMAWEIVMVEFCMWAIPALHSQGGFYITPTQRAVMAYEQMTKLRMSKQLHAYHSRENHEKICRQIFSNTRNLLTDLYHFLLMIILAMKLTNKLQQL